MNRPFYAFGLLMAFLALAMLAIGLSSQPRERQTSAGGSGSRLPSRKPSRKPGVTLFVMVLAEDQLDLFGWEEVDTQAGRALCGVRSSATGYDAGCLQGGQGDVVEFPYLWRGYSATDSPQLAGGLSSVTIEPAMPVRFDELGLAHWASGYDSAYDLAMNDLPSSGAAVPIGCDDQQPGEIDEMLVVFESLLRSEMPQIERKSNPRPISRRRWDYEGRALVMGAQNHLWRAIESARLDDEWQAAARQTGWIWEAEPSTPGPTWAEYVAWIASKQWTVAKRDSQYRTLGAIWSAPSDQVLQIAVSGLNHVAELLHELVSTWLNQAGTRVAYWLAQAPAGPHPNSGHTSDTRP